MTIDWANALSTCAEFAQIGTAGLAAWLAWKALRVDKDAALVEVFNSRVLDVVSKATTVKTNYLRLLDGFSSHEAKAEANTIWLQSKESVAEALSELAIFFAEISSLQRAWEVVDRIEDSAAVAADPAASNSKAARTDYVKAHMDFVRAGAELLRKVRSRGLTKN